MKLLRGPIYRKFRPYVIRSVLCARAVAARAREPFFDIGALLRYVKNGKPYVTTRLEDFTDRLTVEAGGGCKYVWFEGEAFAFPADQEDGLCAAGLDAALNEQLRPDSPHRYMTADRMGPEWVVYDLGAAEGYQAKQWSKRVKQVIIFEPFPLWHQLLEKTFKEEIKAGRVKIFALGLSNREKSIEYRGERLDLRPLDDVVEEYGLPSPDYVKVDIEGEEKNFIAGAARTLTSGSMKRLDICVYHRPRDYVEIPALLEEFGGTGRFSGGIMLFNRDGTTWGNHKKLYHPVLRKCLYTLEMERSGTTT